MPYIHVNAGYESDGHSSDSTKTCQAQVAGGSGGCGVYGHTATGHNVADINELFNDTEIFHNFNADCPHKLGGSSVPTKLFSSTTDNTNPNQRAHYPDLSPILLAISLGTVYAFYPSIAPYSIIDFQYASVIELWILFISALIPIALAILDTIPIAGAGSINYKYGPSGCLVELKLAAGSNIEVDNNNKYLKFSGQSINLSDIKVKHPNTASKNDYHDSTCQAASGDPTQFHVWKSNSNELPNVSLKKGDKYKVSATSEKTVPELKDHGDISDKKPSSITYRYYFNWFMNDTPKYNLKDGGGTGSLLKVKLNLTGASGTTINQSIYTSSVTYTKVSDGTTYTGNPEYEHPTSYDARYWNLVWFSAIFYILCIQIFMTLLHYPHCLLSCHCNNHPYAVVFLSVLFNTLRELMQACAFSGAGKQYKNLNKYDTSTHTGKIIFGDKTFSNVKWKDGGSPTLNNGDVKLDNKPSLTAKKDNYTEIKASSTFKFTLTDATLSPDGLFPNGTIAATNKLITLFVMMFCVFTGDGYLQHYRRCCRDCWPTTGYTRYQSFRYWLRCGFKGGSKSFTTAFTDGYHRNIRQQIISYA